MDITKLSRSLAEHFGENLGYTEEKTDLLRFGFEIIIGEGLKLAVLIVIAVTYDILPEMLSTMITFFTFRFISGGAHSNSHEGCLVMTTLFFSGIAFISSIHGSVFADNFRIFFLIVFIISAVAITLWAPAENKNRPIKLKKRKRLKTFSYVLLVIWALSINAAAYFSIFQSGVLFASTLAVILQSFIQSPAGFRLMEYTDSVIKEKEGKTNAQQT
jgi:accessory gene regulator B